MNRDPVEIPNATIAAMRDAITKSKQALGSMMDWDSAVAGRRCWCQSRPQDANDHSPACNMAEIAWRAIEAAEKLLP